MIVTCMHSKQQHSTSIQTMESFHQARSRPGFLKRIFDKICRAINLPSSRNIFHAQHTPTLGGLTRPSRNINRHFSIIGTDSSRQLVIIFKPATSHWLATVATYDEIPADVRIILSLRNVWLLTKKQKPELESWRSWPWTNLPGSEDFKDSFEYFGCRESYHSDNEVEFWGFCGHPPFEAQELRDRLIAIKENLANEKN